MIHLFLLLLVLQTNFVHPMNTTDELSFNNQANKWFGYQVHSKRDDNKSDVTRLGYATQMIDEHVPGFQDPSLPKWGSTITVTFREMKETNWLSPDKFDDEIRFIFGKPYQFILTKAARYTIHETETAQIYLYDEEAKQKIYPLKK